MIVTVVGKTDVNFVDKSGKTVRGTRIYGIYPFPDGAGEGSDVFTEYISAQRMQAAGFQIAVGSKIDLDYSQKGKLIGLRPVDSLDDDLLGVE